jgi:ABC-type Fe3+/spermidine/putrescine transport system ATPase subunit
MQSNKINTVLFFKDVESNLIEEAVIVVKSNINLKEKESKKELIDKNAILKEAEFIINNKIEENNKSFMEFKISKLLKKYKYVKIVNICLLILIIILFLT